MLDVAVVGEAAVDFVVQVDRLPARGDFALARTYGRFAGGNAGNVAAGLARLGARVSFFGQLGDDRNGRFLARAFERSGVDTSNILWVPGYETPTCLVLVERGGSRVIIGLPRTATKTDVHEFDLDLVHRSRCLFIGPSHTGLAREIMAAVDLPHTLRCYAPGGLCHYLESAELTPVLRDIDILFLNEAEALALTGAAALDLALAQLSSAGPELIVVTSGKRGALVAQGRDRYRSPAIEVDVVRDTTGAGDAFASGFVASYLRGLNRESSACVGAAVAALVMRRLGARSGMPSWEEALALATSHLGRPLGTS